jgi:hypothetical protein
VPVLARTFEVQGLTTILVTNMPYWAEKVGVPRTLAVEFPFGHTLGQPHNARQQMTVIHQALEVLGTAEKPGEIVHSPEVWPEAAAEAQKSWQPLAPSPIIKEMGPKIREMLRRRRNKIS